MTNDGMNAFAQNLVVPARPRAVRLAQALAACPSPPVTAEQLERQAYARGFADGARNLDEQLLRQRLEFRQLQERVLEPLGHAVADVIRDAEEHAAKLALEVAQRLVSGLPIDAAVVQGAVREALAQVKDTSEIHVYLHPDDLLLLENSGDSGPAPDAAPLHFHGAPEIERAGCVVRTRFGTVDTQRKTKLEQLRKAVAS
jgi:flagellar biosynthesis/type III secretory pathway protein FliH